MIEAVAGVFGGCCANVITLEQIVQRDPSVGDLITLAQFLAVTIVGLLRCALKRQRLPPARPWIVPAALYFAVSILNNRAWDYSISVPLHTVFRSCGALMSLLAGLLVGRRYTRQQVLGVLVVTGGVILSVSSTSNGSNQSTQLFGLFLLALAAILAAVQGLVVDKRGPWQASLLMTHMLSLPFFIPLLPSVARQAARYHDWKMLLGNCVTQYVCVRGVNQLTEYGPLTVSVVLSARKMASLTISVFFYGNVAPTVVVGAVVVASGVSLYASSAKTQSQPHSQSKKAL